MTRLDTNLVRAYTEAAFGGVGEPSLDRLVDPDFVLHLAHGDHFGVEGLQIDATAWREGFPDLTVEIVDVLGDENRVARRFVLRGTHAGPYLGIAATGATIAVEGIAIDRLNGSSIQETWLLIDHYRLSQQLRGKEKSRHLGA